MNAQIDESRYTAFDPFSGEEGDMRMRQVRMVTTRNPHPCTGNVAGGSHEIPVGSRARFEKALVDGSYWGRYWMCTGCLDKDLALGEGDDE